MEKRPRMIRTAVKVCDTVDYKDTVHNYLMMMKALHPRELNSKPKKYYLTALGLKKEITAAEAKMYPKEFVIYE